MRQDIGRKIGIMGGTFDPIHIGHLILAENARDKFQLDSVLVMPNGNPQYKADRKITAAETRIRMVELAIEDNVNLNLSLVETSRAGYTYTYETLEMLKDQYSDYSLYFILGADSLYELEQWKYPERICKNCIILVANRYYQENADLDVRIEQLQSLYQAKICKLDSPNIDVSSEMIRNRVKEEKTITYYVPKKVEQYIKEHQLYLSAR